MFFSVVVSGGIVVLLCSRLVWVFFMFFGRLLFSCRLLWVSFRVLC